jgi:beta-glucosidase
MILKKTNSLSRYSFAFLILFMMILAISCSPQTETEVSAPENPTTLDADLSIEARVQNLLSSMTLEEKIGQMTLIEKDSLLDGQVSKLFLGGVLSGGGGSPRINTVEAWGEMVDGFQTEALSTRLGIPILYGVDAVHGHGNLYGATIFPHNIGLGAANDPDLMKRIGEATAKEMAATGIYWNYAPVLAVARDIRWGRTYESYSEDTDLVATLGTAYLRGLQGADLAASNMVLGTIKHYVGDGGTVWGTGSSGYYIDQGTTAVDEATLRAVHLPPYQSAIDAGARSLMISFSSWGGMKMHAQEYLITDVLRGEMGFEGFIVSDWGGIDQINTSYYQSVVAAINAGVDMNMVPSNADRFINTMFEAVEAGDIPMERVDEAVRSILRVKFELGLFANPFSNSDLREAVGSEDHRALAQEAVSKSLVLLKNENSALPLDKDARLFYVAGQGADDIGMMCGGWTIEWQGKIGPITPGTTILEAISNTVSTGTEVVYDVDGNFEGIAAPDACVVVLGERPYTEGQGDSRDLLLPSRDLEVLERVEELCDNLIVVLISGRPLIITEKIKNWDALVAAWLPGTEGQGVADVLFGDQGFRGKLPFTWPRAAEQLPFDFENLGTGEDGPLFPYGFGLGY